MKDFFDKQFFWDTMTDNNYWPDVPTQLIRSADDMNKILKTKQAKDVWMIEQHRNSTFFYFQSQIDEPPFFARHRICFINEAMDYRIYAHLTRLRKEGATVRYYFTFLFTDFDKFGNLK
jgi:hypothetical protein